MRMEALLGLAAASALVGCRGGGQRPPSAQGTPPGRYAPCSGTPRPAATPTTAPETSCSTPHVMGDWKLLLGVDGLYGSTHGETTAQAWDAYLEANYYITPRFYCYVGGRYDDDRFSGFAYHAALKSGVG